MVSHLALNIGTLRHALGCEFKPPWRQTLFRTQAQHLCFIHDSILIWYYYLSVKFVMWIVEQIIENKKIIFKKHNKISIYIYSWPSIVHTYLCNHFFAFDNLLICMAYLNLFDHHNVMFNLCFSFLHGWLPFCRTFPFDWLTGSTSHHCLVKKWAKEWKTASASSCSCCRDFAIYFKLCKSKKQLFFSFAAIMTDVRTFKI